MYVAFDIMVIQGLASLSKPRIHKKPEAVYMWQDLQKGTSLTNFQELSLAAIQVQLG